ncbi:MAG: PilZ domain-containing protein [Candidatus Devosia phytovorans]|uniref:PilZ domain-containing protein n=1 Tax=Candidatus Devosia phytovorans TaxID=3121372 RepID=A0AAJ5VYL1_9HYPH|nr:PilZ domain-containing protein [Devosia sp.]WEK05822.1 MAG: PilZ domain-containing protein [Devosia sp.]
MKSWIEKRQHKREALRIAATAVMQDGLVRQDVLVVNLSRSGAMVELCESIDLSDDFTLLFNHSLEPCHVVWRQAQFAGVQFSHVMTDEQQSHFDSSQIVDVVQDEPVRQVPRGH